MIRKKLKRRPILDFYSRSEDGSIIIDIDVKKVDFLFNNFDKNAPYIKRDLDQDLVEYLMDSVQEIGKEPFIIYFRISERINKSLESRLRTSIQNYFLYSRELEYRELKQMRRTSLILFSIGIGILTISVWITRYLFPQDSVLSNVFSESLAVAAWVSLWEALATFLINWAPHRRQIRNSERLAYARILFK